MKWNVNVNRTNQNLYTNTVLDGSVTLSVRYRNPFPVVQFQNQAHIWSPHGTGHVFKTIWGAAGGPNFFFTSFTAAEGESNLNPF